ncbi:hypothetical protein BDZ97DRAFT_1933627 [Flammula alnicola]|nr:hypothetical protein BDZ97DRAFT_1933627 [Flammula alnicola]
MPYTSSIASSSSYMPKPFIHLFGPLSTSHSIPALSATKAAAEEGTLSFGVFTLRDLKAGEEIVLGWEWDDGNMVHNLPALLQAPRISHHYSPSTPTSLHEVQHIHNQMLNILHALSSAFTTCACGACAKDWALFIEGQEHQLNAQCQRHEQE